MPFHDALAHLDAGGRMLVTCPDGLDRVLWGYNKATGDLFVLNWPGDVWLRNVSGLLMADFDV
jgi:hypothetical protein